MKCDSCANFMVGVNRCKFCNWEYDPGYNPWNRDDWDIFEMNENVEWSHIQLRKRLKSQGFDCLSADIWLDGNIAWIICCNNDCEHLYKEVSNESIAKALNIHEDCVYCDLESGLTVLNLFQEKYLRGMIGDEKEES